MPCNNTKYPGVKEESHLHKKVIHQHCFGKKKQQTKSKPKHQTPSHIYIIQSLKSDVRQKNQTKPKNKQPINK